MGKKSGWQHFHHVADIRIRGYGRSVEMAFTQATMAMTAVITESALVDNTTCINVECDSVDLKYSFNIILSLICV